MKHLINLLYTLNKQNFCRSNIILYQLNHTGQEVIWCLYLFMRGVLYLAMTLVLYIYIAKMTNDNVIYWFLQMMLVLSSVFIFSQQPQIMNTRVKLLDFLLGQTFDANEKQGHLKYLAYYYMLWLILTSLLVNTSLIPCYVNKPLLVFVSIIILMINCYYVYTKINRYTHYQKTTTFKYLSYLIFLALTPIVIYLSQDMKIYPFRLNNNAVYLFVILLVALICKMMIDIFNKRKINSKQYFKGLNQDYLSKYIEGAAGLFFVPIWIMRFLPISDISKLLIVMGYLVLFFSPNFCSLVMLNYIKVVGKPSAFKKYHWHIFKCVLCLQLIALIILSINIHYIILSVILLALFMLLRYVLFVIIICSGYPDTKKADIYSMTIIATIFLMFVTAYIMKGI